MSNSDEIPAVPRPDPGSRRGRRWVTEAERLARSGLGAVKTRARRDDRVGEVTHRALDLVSGALPERFALAGIKAIKTQARRNDVVGEVAYRTLKIMNTGFEMALRTLNRFENASEPPAREPRRRRPARRSTSTRRRTGAARSSARRVTGQARRTRTAARRSA